MKKKIGMQKLIRLVREECGAELVEFAMSALILMGLIVGVIGFAMAMYTYHFVSTAAQQGTRFAMVRGHTWSTGTTVNCATAAPPNFVMVYDCTASATDIRNYVQSRATAGINPASVTISTSNLWPGTTPDGGTCSPTNGQGCSVKVIVSYSFNYFNIYPFRNMSGLTMTATSEGVIVQ